MGYFEGELYPECVYGSNFIDSLIRCVNRTGRRFIFICVDIAHSFRISDLGQKRNIGQNSE